jgi:hypothetical protein
MAQSAREPTDSHFDARPAPGPRRKPACSSALPAFILWKGSGQALPASISVGIEADQLLITVLTTDALLFRYRYDVSASLLEILDVNRSAGI